MTDAVQKTMDMTYNWDDIQVGQPDLNSDSFFTRNPVKHEKFYNLGSENNEKMSNKENRIKQTVKSFDEVVIELCETKVGDTNVDSKPKPLKNILTQPIAKANPTVTAVLDKNEKHAVPTVYKYREIYERKKKTKLQKMLEEETKMRVFHSKPAPKFSCHDPKTKPQHAEVIAYTVPKTPEVLKKSKEAEQRRRQAIEDYKKRNNPQKFHSRDPHVLYDKPFIPKKPERHVEPQPFHLHVEKRLEERKQYDQQFHKKIVEKKKQEEDEKKRRDEEIVRELRKLTTFKARPNPFK